MISSGDRTGIVATIDRLQLEAKSLLQSAIEISYYSRGAIPYETVLNMSAIERDLAVEFLQKRLKEAQKNPFGGF
jgi:hypothetical protein